MKYPSTILRIAFLTLLLTFNIYPQTAKTETKHYEQGGLAFDYPEGWEVSDSTSAGVQTVTLARKGTAAQIAVHVQDGLGLPGDVPPVQRSVTLDLDPCDFEAKRQTIAHALTERIAVWIHADVPHSASPVTTQIEGSEVAGTQLQGVVNQTPVTAAVFSTRLKRRFVSLTYIFANNDDKAKSAWNTIRTTLAIEPRVVAIMGVTDHKSDAPITSGVENGRLVLLPRPEYPKLAKAAHASGTVAIQVTIDEQGNVISAHAVSGHPLLHATCVAAAKQAKFSPTKMCGEPVRVTGVIDYNFVAQ